MQGQSMAIWLQIVLKNRYYDSETFMTYNLACQEQISNIDKN